jgi:SAM-dependent methyltransferase
MRERLPRLLKKQGERLLDRAGTGQIDRLARVSARIAGAVAGEQERRRVAMLDDTDWLRWVYRDVFDRDPDAMGLEHWRQQLHDGMARSTVRQILASSTEAHNGPAGREALAGFHESRMSFTRSLPPARRILDLGGTSLDSALGSLLIMGYPYDFDELVIVDLPSSERHALYQAGDNEDLVSGRGLVRYLFRSMVDLDDLPDRSVDLIVSGQTFEHITPSDGELMLSQVGRLLSFDGVLALDTPNRDVTAVQCAATGETWINPDHKMEYTHRQMVELFAAAGLEAQRAHGLGFMPDTFRTGVWHPEELAHNRGMYAAIEQCYTLAYVVGRAR